MTKLRDRAKPSGHLMSGKDGRWSWSKTVLAAVLALYALSRPLPTTVAIVCILASFGSKVLLEGLALMEVRLGAVDQLQRVAETARIEEHKVVDATARLVLEKRDADTGEPMPGAPGQEIGP